MVDWTLIRAQFPSTRKYTYLNAAGGSPMSVPAADAAKAFYDQIVAEGDVVWEEWLEKKEKVRDQIAAFINAERSEIAFTQNTSHGMNLIADMLCNKDGIITMHDEFPTSTYPWLYRNYDLKFVHPENNIYSIENIEKNITANTRILVTSHVQYRTGFRQDLEKVGELCRKRGLYYIVNATQSMGAFPVDVKKAGIDFLAFMGLKWPMAGYGIGVLYINKKQIEKLHFPVLGWLSVENPEIMDNRKMNQKKEASALEVGCPHFPNIFGLGAAVNFLSEIGKENIFNRIQELNEYLTGRINNLNLEILSPLERKHRSGITVIKMDNAEEVASELARKSVIVSARGEGLRISIHVYNNKQDIDVFIKSLEEVLSA
jgi:selenocysteine lyase/cysteine desulfurase